jgi:thioredoxin 1
MNLDDSAETAAKLGIMGIPTLKYFKGGKVLGTLAGVVSKERVEDLLKKGF